MYHGLWWCCITALPDRQCWITKMFKSPNPSVCKEQVLDKNRKQIREVCSWKQLYPTWGENMKKKKKALFIVSQRRRKRKTQLTLLSLFKAAACLKWIKSSSSLKIYIYSTAEREGKIGLQMVNFPLSLFPQVLLTGMHRDTWYTKMCNRGKSEEQIRNPDNGVVNEQLLNNSWSGEGLGTKTPLLGLGKLYFGLKYLLCSPQTQQETSWLLVINNWKCPEVSLKYPVVSRLQMLKLHHHLLHLTDMEASMYWESEMTWLLVNVIDNSTIVYMSMVCRNINCPHFSQIKSSRDTRLTIISFPLQKHFI